MSDPEDLFVPLDFERLPPDESEARGRAFLDSVTRRRSVREFSSDPVPRAWIERAILAAGTAPSGAHRQPWRFVAVSDPATKRRIREAAEEEERKNYAGRMPPDWQDALAPLGTGPDKPYLEVVPWLVVCFEERHGVDEAGEKVKNYYTKESVGIACGLFVAAVHQMGLATLTHTPSPMGFLADILEAPPRLRPFLLFPVGYPAPGAQVPDLERFELTELARFVE